MQDLFEAAALPEASTLSLPITTPGIPRLSVPKPLAMRACRRFNWKSFMPQLPCPDRRLEHPLDRVAPFVKTPPQFYCKTRPQSSRNFGKVEPLCRVYNTM